MTLSDLPPSHEGAVTYFRRVGSEKVHVRFSVKVRGKNKQIRVSTGETDYRRARIKADDLYKKYLGKAEAGLALSAATFSKVAAGYIAEQKKMVVDGEANAVAVKEERAWIERYLIPYFKDTQIAAIDQAAVDNYLRWRTVYWVSGPGKNEESHKYERNGKNIVARRHKTKPRFATLLKDVNILRRLLKYAVRSGALKANEKIMIRPPKGQVGRRPDFEDHEITQLLNYLLERVTADDLEAEERERRYKLWAFVVIAVSSGMRPSEILGLKWNGITGFIEGKDVPLSKLLDVRIEDLDVRFTIWDSKRGRKRRIVPLRSMPSTVINLWEFSGKKTGDKFVFADENGDLAKGYGRAIARALDKLEIRETATGERRSQYSFRHYYITRMIRAGKSPAFVAHNVGTSIEMIERFYLHGDVEHYAKQLGEF